MYIGVHVQYIGVHALHAKQPIFEPFKILHSANFDNVFNIICPCERQQPLSQIPRIFVINYRFLKINVKHKSCMNKLVLIHLTQ